MEILNYTEKHHQFRSDLQAFFESEVKPNADKWEADHIVPREAWRKMGQAGFLCPTVPEEYGGRGGDFLYSEIVVQELIKTRQTGMLPFVHSDVVVPYITSYGSEELKHQYLPGCVSGDIVTAVAMTEPDAGSDLSSMTATVVEDGDMVVINGSKTFITNGIHADLVILAVKDPSEKDPYKAISIYAVDADASGFKKGRNLDKMGFYSQDTAELFFNDCRIPQKNILGEKGGGFIMLMEKLQQERLICAMSGIAYAETIHEHCVNFCKTTTSAKGKPLSKRQAVQFALVEMATEILIGRTFVDKLLADHMEKRQVMLETSMAKYWTSDLANRIADRSMDLCGDYGLLEACPILRHWRDARILPIFAGTNEIMKQLSAKFMGF